MTSPTREQVRMLAHRAARMTADDSKIEGFAIPQSVDDALMNKYEFVYYLVWFAQEEEREACAIAGGAAAMAGLDHVQVAKAIRARGNT